MEDKKEHFARPTMQKPASLLNLTIVAVLLGFLAGFGGYFFGQIILPNTNVNYLNLSQWPGFNNSSSEQTFIDFAQRSATSIAGIYKQAATSPSIGEPIYGDEDFLGSAVVVTSDGWLMTSDQVTKNKQVQVVLGDKIYEVADVKQDPFSKTVFLKINANFLSPVDFQITDNVNTGESLFTSIDSTHSLEHSFYTGVLSNSHYVVDKYLSADQLDYYYQIAEEPSAKLNAAPFFNLKGNMIGLAYKLDQGYALIPAEYLKQAVKNLLNNTDRIRLGVYYIDLENNVGFTRKGVLVYHPSLAAVTPNLPAAKAKLKPGDQIVAINNNIITSNRSLTSIIQTYRNGEKVTIKIFRNGQEQDIEIQL